MKLIYEILILSVLILTSFSSLGARTQASSNNKTITVCRFELTSMGKMASFHFNYMYRISTDETGAVQKVSRLDKRKAEMISEDKLLDCIRTWKLGPSDRYAVVFSIGTTSDPNYITIAGPKQGVLKLLLP